MFKTEPMALRLIGPGKLGILYPPLFVLIFGISAFAGTLTYRLDFGPAASPVAEGFASGEVASLVETTDPTFSVPDDCGSHPIEISFQGAIGGFSLGNAAKPLTTDGIYSFKAPPEEGVEAPATNELMEIGFVISGLPPNSLVTFYGMSAWDGEGRAAYLSLGESGPVDIGTSTEPKAGDCGTGSFTLVAQNEKVGADGTLRGIFSNSDGSQPRVESQWGAFVLSVETP